MHINTVLLCVILCLGISTLSAQEKDSLNSRAIDSLTEDFTLDSVFFTEQFLLFNDWLGELGLQDKLIGDSIDIYPSFVKIYLSLISPEDITAVEQWNVLKEEFELERPLTLEQQLFYEAVELMQLEQQQELVYLIISDIDTRDSSEVSPLRLCIQFIDGSVIIFSDSCN